MIIDAQVHIWPAETAERPWSSHETHLPQPFGYADLLREMKDAGVDRAVLIPPGWEGDRIDYVLEGAQRHPDTFGAMGRISIHKREIAAPQVPGWMRQPGMLGARLSFQKPERQVWLEDGSTDWFWPEAEKLGIPLMIFAPSRFDVIRNIATAHPRLKIIVDHMGLAREKDEPAIAVIEQLCGLADCPNVAVKASSVPFYSTEPYPYRNLHGALRRLVAAFGPKRVFWGTDITRIWKLTSYRRCVTLFTEELPFLSAGDLDWIMGRGIAEWLNWPAPAASR